VDTATGEEIGHLLLDLNAAGQTLVLVTHNPDLAAKYASRVVRMADGRIIGDTASGAARGYPAAAPGREAADGAAAAWQREPGARP
jgi:energy-coupling factor transporter ATP-binding protein EcfA2